MSDVSGLDPFAFSTRVSSIVMMPLAFLAIVKSDVVVFDAPLCTRCQWRVASSAAGSTKFEPKKRSSASSSSLIFLLGSHTTVRSP